MSEAVQGRGRPLRFLAVVVAGWVTLRVALLWPQAESMGEAIRSVVPLASAHAEPKPGEPRMQFAGPVSPHRLSVAAATRPSQPALPLANVGSPERAERASLGLFQLDAAEDTAPPSAPAAPQTAFVPAQSRWSGSAWLTLRPGSGIGAAPGGQLGGSQAGARIAYLVDPRRRIALFGRVVTPVSGPGREGSIGIEWQPTRAPVRLVAEQRFNGGRGGQGLGLVAGVDTGISGGFRLESYGQAGAIRRDRIEPYADGAVRLTHPVPGTRFALGAGAWGAAQRDAQRLDVGPSATLTLPVAGQSVRVALDWRQRVAGDARPGSGLALTLGSDF